MTKPAPAILAQSDEFTAEFREIAEFATGARKLRNAYTVLLLVRFMLWVGRHAVPWAGSLHDRMIRLRLRADLSLRPCGLLPMVVPCFAPLLFLRTPVRPGGAP